MTRCPHCSARLESISRFCPSCGASLKPSNVMIDGAGRARLADFGIARLGADGGVSGEVVGTLPYMAPEQLAGQGATTKADLYSLGLLLYEMFAGRPTFRADSLSQLVRMQDEEDFPKLSAIIPELDRSSRRPFVVAWPAILPPDEGCLSKWPVAGRQSPD